MGRRYGNDATLAVVDIVVVKDKNIFLAIEIEERTCNPKKVIGDVFGIALADKMRIQGEIYSINDAIIIIAIVDEGKGKQSAKYTRFERHLDRYFKANPSKIVKKVRIISCPIEDLVRRIERLIRLETGKQT